jgi:DNA-binding NarL/FixJ family response regulator
MAQTLLIVDDHASFRGFVRSLLEDGEFHVTGEAEDGETALTEIERLHPDVVLLDVQLPGIDGFEVAQRVAGTCDAPRVVLTSSREASDYGKRLEQSPVSGFISKGELSSDSLAALVSG